MAGEEAQEEPGGRDRHTSMLTPAGSGQAGEETFPPPFKRGGCPPSGPEWDSRLVEPSISQCSEEWEGRRRWNRKVPSPASKG